jgi:hypothetical protein
VTCHRRGGGAVGEEIDLVLLDPGHEFIAAEAGCPRRSSGEQEVAFLVAMDGIVGGIEVELGIVAELFVVGIFAWTCGAIPGKLAA